MEGENTRPMYFEDGVFSYQLVLGGAETAERAAAASGSHITTGRIPDTDGEVGLS